MPVIISGHSYTPITVYVDLSGLPARLPTNWGFQLIGFKDGDLGSSPYLMSGVFSDPLDRTPISGGSGGWLVPAGEDGLNTPHTFLPPTPTEPTTIVIYAVAGVRSL